jgi:hypothetical protein
MQSGGRHPALIEVRAIVFPLHIEAPTHIYCQHVDERIRDPQIEFAARLVHSAPGPPDKVGARTGRRDLCKMSRRRGPRHYPPCLADCAS